MRYYYFHARCCCAIDAAAAAAMPARHAAMLIFRCRVAFRFRLLFHDAARGCYAALPRFSPPFRYMLIALRQRHMLRRLRATAAGYTLPLILFAPLRRVVDDARCYCYPRCRATVMRVDDADARAGALMPRRCCYARYCC